MPGSAMPSFAFLSEADRRALVAYIKTLAVVESEGEVYNLFKLRGTPTPIQVGTEPPDTPEVRAMGHEVYAKLECWKCHGMTGRGDGPSADELRDEKGYPILPNDFTRGIYKGGGTNRDVYLRFTTGMDGTPMPSYEELATEEERWALVYYVMSLAGTRIAVQPSTGDVPVKRVRGAIPLNPMDLAWDGVEAVTIPLMLLYQRPEAPSEITVRAMHNGEMIAVMVEWGDGDVEDNFLNSESFTDAAAIQFSLSADPPRFAMGKEGSPINIWSWKAYRQLDVAAFKDVDAIYRGMAVDWYPFERGAEPTTGDWNGHPPFIASAAAYDPTFLTGVGAGNPVSQVYRMTPVEDLNAEGFGTLTSQPAEGQNVQGYGVWAAGHWRVVFARQMVSKDRYDATFKSGGAVPIAFAVWDGAKKDRDGQKSVTTWYTLRLER
jgi:mono/diheme cytochrome c family protein